MKVLAIDTSTYVMGVAITDGDKVLGEYITNIKKNHSIRLMPAIELLMKEVGITAKELDKIVVAQGPGSYTGVRIAVTTAKTLAWSLSIPVVGVSSLHVLAQNGRGFAGYICPLYDARRGQIYTGLYQTTDTMDVIKVEEDRLLLASEWATLLKEKKQDILFIGNDVTLHKSSLVEQLQQHVFVAPPSLFNPRPSELALLGACEEGESNVHLFSPTYLQLAEAESKWLEAQQMKGNENE
ncbi:tRNA (adenosine(37)-N6)-threonylcarbamoyltransferase complex dimerization subunit type 1 TsaB [Alkalihalobacillus sp. LMS39]|uniref:tRNA (adenosine(37)-N6)-threonylcarbamoyltransferase complex dimerization subunit type 1 TsaB n=1 Tax=Alkalihalobacillus sp. LMS39 TaxID=2924032 RepID=UPI001FB3819E|nr:tRNA (adenosine(37)-N6)-threonylcarbamoyltransferase complex dimerization subunit type 1 TsaB [Alkalihalobacillus sp. LMS39]UOE94375.1 tRNA (adenosine(37)-N6)-threonylcarbamoyltransferase complex dimerization subunit type 1 TsaB [Alkalihalobacillus sp. LMS39]